MTDDSFFDCGFEALTGHSPMRWQRRLFGEFSVGRIPDALDLPTGLGKTAVMLIWLLALAAQARSGRPSLPRRLVYVVDRRTVVDQATDTARGIRDALQDGARPQVVAVRTALQALCVDPSDGASPLAISTLRGEYADNLEWQADPARPGIVVGTVDMIGSRLLFSGYGVSRRMRPFHAGLVGQDVLIVHDEAHLSPAFGALLRALEARQAEGAEPRPLRLLDLSATRRDDTGRVFGLTDDDTSEPEVRIRTTAEKILTFEPAPDDHRASLAAIVASARRHHADRKRVVVYLRAPADVRQVAEMLGEGGDDVAILTGTIRGRERDVLAKSPLFESFKSAPCREPLPRTRYLVATSAGEVGIDLDADHMVCDLASLDSMIQRLGRVNRLGRGAATVHVIEIPKKGGKDDADADARLAATEEALMSLPARGGGVDASPAALRTLAHRTDAFAAVPRTVPVTDILLDAWSLTRVAELPGRPPVARWLHGVEAERPVLHVAWREEVSLLGTAPARTVRTLYEKHRILARERLQGPLWEVVAELKKILRRKGDQEADGARPLPAVLIPANGDPVHGSLADLLDDEPGLAEATLVLPPEAGGLDVRGMLDGAAKATPATDYDVADLEDASGASEPAIGRRRARLLASFDAEEERWSVRRLGAEEGLVVEEIDASSWRAAVASACGLFPDMAEKDASVLARDDEGEPSMVLVLLGDSRSLDVSQNDPAAAGGARTLDDHAADVSAMAETIVGRLGPLIYADTAADRAAEAVAEAVVLAARHHDRGKNRPAWQADIGNPPPRHPGSLWVPLAKSGRTGFASRRSGAYRHEFGSLREASDLQEISAHPERDLILHLIASHHGWARPHFEQDQWDIADGVGEEANAEIAAETMRRFARLQRRFGHWGLAWLEGLMRAADYAASRGIPRDPERAAEAMAEEGTT
ncbi:type I-G CRISPR-associated helicase/endonuclease Cas3g [Rhodovulum sp. PH10]|uniref:type I-G CRISPR-associated helicase/endonuclease Cas3g n=1 Tax=Rhodovulum sp. PH10 TaxID=1187851 RepID=UPI000309F83E|nr:type I-U CRISPR-associated helicase/endonuclease Cas3 [Rhodovulum sp. PH10]